MDSIAQRFVAIWRGKPPTISPNEVRTRRVHAQRVFLEDTADARKLAWLKTLRPRLTKGQSGVWWCASKHEKPTFISVSGTRVYHRVGVGNTPREAYDSWLEF